MGRWLSCCCTGWSGLIRRLVRREAARKVGCGGYRRLIFVLLWVYVLFKLLWGLNYDRLGIAEQLQLHVQPYRRRNWMS